MHKFVDTHLNGARRRGTMARHGGAIAHRRHTMARRRGTILIFVVALLGMLFLVGAAFLSTVTFENAAVASKQEVREDDAVLDAVRAETLKCMNLAWLGRDGVPYNSDVTTSRVRDGAWLIDLDPAAADLNPLPDHLVDVYGEVPELHPLVAPIEPFEFKPSDDRQPWAWPGSTDLKLLGLAVPWHAMDSWSSAEQPPLLPDETAGRILRLPATAPPDEPDTDVTKAVRDADGDGIVDSIPHRLDPNVFPLELRRPMANRLRDPELTELTEEEVTAGYTLDDLFVALRIVPHSGLASVSGAHNKILERVIGPGYKALMRSVYTASAEERSLRRRGFLPGLNRPQSVLVDEELKPELLDVLDDDPGDAKPARWWPFDLGPSPVYDTSALADGEFPTAYDEQYSAWVNWMDSNNTVNPDVRHLVTTISYDDNLLRGPQGAAGADVYDPADLRDGSQGAPLKAIAMYPGDDGASDGTNPDASAIPDEYRGGSLNLAVNYAAGTAVSPGGFDARHGRLKLSLDSLDPPKLATELGFHVVNHPTQREKDTVQGAFTLMLRNVDANRNGDPADDTDWQSDQAAQLTANFFDFVDNGSDGGDWDADGKYNESTEVVPFQLTGSLKRYRGVERQPFISEVVAKVTKVDVGDDYTPGVDLGYFAVELCNPYANPGGWWVLPLDNYELAVYDATGVFKKSWALAAPDLSAPYINWAVPGNLGYVVLDSDGTIGQKLNGLEILPGETVELKCKSPNPLNPTRFVVDRFRADKSEYMEDSAGIGDPGAPFCAFRPSAVPGDESLVSLQRDTNGGGWKVCVPFYAKFEGSHTLTSDNSYDSSDGDNPIAPVYPIPSDAGNIADFSQPLPRRLGMPTTGCMLLLMRYAHELDANFDDVTDHLRRFTPFTERLHSDPNLVPLIYANGALQRASVDNGHMPLVMDPAGQAADSAQVPLFTELARAATAGATTRGQALEIPWGQLVFDYFTALPRKNTYDSLKEFNAADVETIMPTVDQDGLRVHGRISINTAPWKVLSGLPRFNANGLPVYRELGGDATYAQISADGSTGMSTLGDDLAQTIVAYRERREVVGETGSALTGDWSGNAVPGFLTVGELILASANGSAARFRFDSYPTVPPYDYLHAAARLVALSDWVTTRGHVFTIYGTISGVGEKDKVDRRALRFQETVDRLPSMFDSQAPRRIGQQSIGRQADARSD